MRAWVSGSGMLWHENTYVWVDHIKDWIKSCNYLLVIGRRILVNVPQLTTKLRNCRMAISTNPKMDGIMKALDTCYGCHQERKKRIRSWTSAKKVNALASGVNLPLLNSSQVSTSNIWRVEVRIRFFLASETSVLKRKEKINQKWTIN